MSMPVVLDLPFAPCAFSAAKTAKPSKNPPSKVSSWEDRKASRIVLTKSRGLDSPFALSK